MYENVLEHQLSVYAQSKNLDLGSLNDTQRAALKEEMIAEQYPGKTIALWSTYNWSVPEI